MKLAQVHFRLAIEHPSLGGGFSKGRDRFRAKSCPELGKDEEVFDIELVGQSIKLTYKGKTRHVNIVQAIWWDELKG